MSDKGTDNRDDLPHLIQIPRLEIPASMMQDITASAEAAKLISKIGTKEESGNGHRPQQQAPPASAARPERHAPDLPPPMPVNPKVLPKPKPTIMTARELQLKTFAPTVAVVEKLLHEGLSICAGRTKIGKSWLWLQVLIAIAFGGRALGKIPVDTGDVLYLGLEDGQGRLQKRINLLLDGEPAPERMDIADTWPTLDEGGIEFLESWIESKENPRAIVIDTLKRVRPKAKVGKPLYDVDYEALAPLADLAHKYPLAILVNHHARKQDSADPLDLISGSTGLSAPGDGAVVMKRSRGEADAVLSVVHRDAEDAEIALRWRRGSVGWEYAGEASEFTLTPGRRAVVELLTSQGVMSIRRVAAHLGKSANTTKVLLFRMAQDGQVKALGDGMYGPSVLTN